MKILKTNFKYQAKELFMNSSIHGIRYIAEDHRTSIEKFIWFCIVVISATSGLVTISELWDKFQTNPTITGLDTDFTLKSINFPTVVVCPLIAYDNLSVYHVAKEFIGNHMSDFDSNIPLLEGLTTLTYGNVKELDAYLADINKNTISFWNRQSLRELVFKVNVHCENIFESCTFNNDKEKCCSIFNPIYTEQGFCYAFNSRYFGTGLSEEKNEELNSIQEDDFWELKIFLKEEADFFIHSTDNVLTYDDTKLFTYNYDTAVDLLLSFKQTYTEQAVDELSISQRKCIFPDKYDDSVTLHYYNHETYSFSYCMKECRMHAVLKFCDCIPPFYAPENNENYKKCLIEDLRCLANYTEEITSSNCNHCQLSCFDKNFEPEKISVIYKEDNGEEIKEKYIKISLSSWPTMQYKKEVLFGWIDLLVASGGTLGLFMGLSLLSVVEIFYFMTVRVIFMFINNRDQLKDIHEKEESKAIDEKYNIDLCPKFPKEKKNPTDIEISNTTFIMVSPSAPLSNLQSF